jgi:hypothetical protein
MLWRTAGAAVTGPAHLIGGHDCQDRFRILTDGPRLIAVVADGAGTVIHASEGAAIAAETLIDALRKPVFEDRSCLSEQALRPFIESSIAIARQKALEAAKNLATTIDEFHSTIVGIVADHSGGSIFHIGDGAAAVIDISESVVISPPENGQFANEAFFYTEEDWLDHLRLTPFGAPDRVMLATDGAACFAFEDGYGRLSKGFFDPLSLVLSSTENRDDFLTQLLMRADAVSASDDDKTLVWAVLQREQRS